MTLEESGGNIGSSKTADITKDSVSSKMSSSIIFKVYVSEGKRCDKGRKLVEAVKSRSAVKYLQILLVVMLHNELLTLC